MRVGDLIKQEIKAKGLQQKIVASIAHIDPANLNRIIKGTKPIDAMSALRLQAAIGIKAEELLRRQADQELMDAKEKFTEEASIKNAFEIHSLVPVQEMMNRGWIPTANLLDTEKVQQELKQFFVVDDLHEVKKKLVHAAKKTCKESAPTPEQLAWIGRARQIASKASVKGGYDKNKAEVLTDQLRPLLCSPKESYKAVEILSEYGIRLVFVEKLKSAKIDGACFWLDEDSPAIAMSLRFDRIDNFFFILRHELEHTFNGDGKLGAMIDSVEASEARADEAYVKFVDPEGVISRSIAACNGYMTAAALEQLAKNLHVHPGIVAGIIQHQTGRYYLFRQFLSKIREFVVDYGKNVDGWGKFVFVF